MAVEVPDKLLTVPEVAERLSCRTETVRRWIAAGQLPAFVLPGGGYRIRESNLERVLVPSGTTRASVLASPKSA